jgi:hypothetical protein
VVAGDGVGVRGVVGDDLLADPACSESLPMGLASVAEALWKVLVEWEVRTQWLSSRLTCDGPRGRRVRVGVGSKLEVGVLAVERNFAEFSSELARDYFGKRHEPSARVGNHGEAALEGSDAVSGAHPGPEDEGVSAVESVDWLVGD